MCVAVPFKRSAQDSLSITLINRKMDALLAAANENTLPRGRRESCPCSCSLYNSGARAEEAAQLTVADLHFHHLQTGMDKPTFRSRGKRREDASMPTVAVNSPRNQRPYYQSRAERARLPQPTPMRPNKHDTESTDVVKTVCANEGGSEDAFDLQRKTSQPARYSPHDSDAPACALG